MLATVSSLLLTSCDDEEATPIDIGPTGPPSIAFADPPSGTGPVCVSVGDDADARVPLLVNVDELVLRPPGACSTYQQYPLIGAIINSLQLSTTWCE